MSAMIVLVSVALAWLRGGKLGRLLELKLVHLELIFVSLFLQYAVSFASAWNLGLIAAYSNQLLILSYILLLAGIWLNRHLPAARMIAIGVLLNAIVIFANGGRMPVSAAALESAGMADYIALLEKGNFLKHTLLEAATPFAFLADVIPLPPPYYPGGKVISAGDVILNLGVFLLVQKTMVVKTRRRISHSG